LELLAFDEYCRFDTSAFFYSPHGPQACGFARPVPAGEKY
jgi:hypothetical protein